MKHSMPARTARAALVVTVALLLAACGSGAIRGEAPLLQSGGWQLDDERLVLSLRLRNVNDDPLQLDALRIEVSLGDAPTMPGRREPLDIDIPAGGFETVAVTLAPGSAAKGELAALASGDVANVPFRVSGAIVSGSVELPIRLEGRVYRVPGRPGEFR